MAIKQRVLTQLNNTKNHMICAVSTGSKDSLGEVYRDLTEARNLCKEGLSQRNYATYGEIYDGMILAVQKMIEDGETDDRGDALALCQELLMHLEKETAKETRFKKELFFLPYQAAMWDSLESIWKAAYEDKEHCNAYVMPIPYADRNPDGSVAEWHYEGAKFPKCVPIIDWGEVDLKAWHPDIIFYHNPYDGCNLVTSVESRYYSENLKKCADRLVYVPYFIFDETCGEDDVKNFALSRGVLNADRVIVQSETIREYYIGTLTKNTNQTSREFWEKRILGLGSPKIDKVLHSRREDFEIPSQWEKLICGRRVILYITSLTPMLANPDKVCDKLRNAFQTFKEQDDVVLWWRPHPLMKATVHSMRPEVEEEYVQLEKEYIEEGWGIYDDSGDLHRAIAYSDAYYGDGSSVHKLYLRTGKPILIQQYQDIDEIKHAFQQGHKGENIPLKIGSELVMEGEPFDLHDLIKAVQHLTHEETGQELEERPRWNVIWEDEPF